MWRRDNEYILTGYRQQQGNWAGCLRSIFGYLHNETVNIHTHLWPAVLFVIFLITYHPAYIAKYESADWRDSAVFAIYILSAIYCLTCSAVYHLTTCHLERVCARCHAFDYSGIVVLTVASFYPGIYYMFFCYPVYQLVYLTAITLAGLCAAYIVLNPEYAKPTHRGARTKVFIALGLCSIAPVLHALVFHGYRKLSNDLGFRFLLLMGFSYNFGAIIYANRIPERFAPGKFDYFFASHQIFHVFVAIAALSHYAFVLTAFHHVHGAEGAIACNVAAA